MTTLPPVLRFLADVDLEMGPFGLLGLTPDTCDNMRIAAALRRQLDRVARHPHGGGVDADEVRLALHVAAAQLSDPSVRQELVEELTTLNVRREHTPRAASTPSPRVASALSADGLAGVRMSAPQRSFEHMAMWVIAHSGGWNAESRRRLWALAHAMNVSQSELPDVVTSVVRRAARTRVGEFGAVQSRRASTELPRVVPEPVRNSPVRKWGPLALIALLTLSSVIMVRVIAVLRGREITSRTIVASESPIVRPPVATIERPDTLAKTNVAGDEAIDGNADASVESAASELNLSNERLTSNSPDAESIVDSRFESWLKFADQVSASAAVAPKPEDRLFRAVRMAMINCAAEQQWADDESSAGKTLESAHALSPYTGHKSVSAADLDAQIFRFTAPATTDDGQVALQFQLARRQPGAPTDALNRLRFRQTPLGPADCDVIAEVAYSAPSLELRGLARRFVDDQSNNPFMVYGLLEGLSRAPKNPSTSELIERISNRKLARVTDSDWARSARAALLSRLFELLAADRLEVVDDLARRLTEAYRAASIASAPVQAGFSSSLQAVPVGEPAGRLFDIWLHRAESFSISQELAAKLDAVLRRHEARLALADGLVQRFAGYQASIVDLAAFVVSAERPATADSIDALIESLRNERRQAHHIFHQIEANERAITRLWMLRVGLLPSKMGGLP